LKLRLSHRQLEIPSVSIAELDGIDATTSVPRWITGFVLRRLKRVVRGIVAGVVFEMFPGVGSVDAVTSVRGWITRRVLGRIIRWKHREQIKTSGTNLFYIVVLSALCSAAACGYR
jgi:hypothetical protein